MKHLVGIRRTLSGKSKPSLFVKTGFNSKNYLFSYHVYLFSRLNNQHHTRYCRLHVMFLYYHLADFYLYDQVCLKLDCDKLECFIGPPLQVSFAEYYNFDEEHTQKAINYYRERFKEKGMFENELYSNIAILLKSLKERGFTNEVM